MEFSVTTISVATGYNAYADFQTPLWVCHYMASLLPYGVKTILEPTPGQGNIVSVLGKYNVVAPDDFFSMPAGNFDAVVMNPPFTPMKKGYDILYSCMGMADVVIALMPWLSVINSAKRTKDLQQFGLKSVTHLPRKVFDGSRVQTCILELNRGYRWRTEFIAL